MSQSVKVDAIVSGKSNNAYNAHNFHHKRVLKSKENLFKTKYDKELKKKLKKYKLRKDGDEDPEVLNVSEILVNSLRIKSPNSKHNLQISSKFAQCEVLKPRNYLFKMVRKRKNCTQINNLQVSDLSNANIDNVVEDKPLQFSEKDSQNKKQMDAFKLMMESRNKSIGGNSPGKEKFYNDIDFQDNLEKKEMKAKRLLKLQKMSEDKGALKKKEIDAYRDRCVEHKMLKRAERLKNMIQKSEMKLGKEKSVSVNNLTAKIENEDSNTATDIETKSSSPKVGTLKLCDIFNDSSSVINNDNLVKKISEEDIEFLNKLSPSLRKKENMLCYFQKLHKDKELLNETESNNEDSLENNYECDNKSIIKVKFTPKRRNKKVLTSIELKTENGQDKNINGSIETTIDVSDSRKRKRNIKVDMSDVSLEKNDKESNVNNEGRPKRNSKIPVKYTEDMHCLSSDEELHIFTPKKKRNKEPNSNDEHLKNTKEYKGVVDSVAFIKKSSKIVDSDKTKKVTNKKIEKIVSKQSRNIENSKKSKNLTRDNVAMEKKNIKLAPIFVTKPQLSLEAMEAKKTFLKSGVPEKLKKNSVHNNINNSVFENFYSVIHVQQLSKASFENVKEKYLFKSNFDEHHDISNVNNNGSIQQFLLLSSPENIEYPSLKQKPDKILKNIKTIYPKFPVYRTYHLLKGKSKGEFKDCNYPDLDNSVEIINNFNDIYNETPEKLSWCDKYKPSSSKQIIGNFDSIRELKKWLESWTEKLIKAKNNSDMSDMSDFYCSDTDSRDTQKYSNNVLVITGKTGSGKTSAVYAVAAELAIKVIEVNASSKRNGKIMLQDLQEATQSHKVDRGKTSDCFQKSQEEPLANIKRRGRPKKSKVYINKNKKSTTIDAESLIPLTTSQENVRTGMSLILIDDADIVFDQDDGFSSAISQLIQSSKRPVILVTSTLSCLHLQKFFQNGKIIHMRPLLPRMLGTWLDIMCLADVGTCVTGLGAKLLDLNKGDIRKTINYLQYYMNSTKVNQVEDVISSQVKCHFDEESSSMSWAESEGFTGTSSESLSTPECDIERRLEQSFFSSKSLDIFNIWWSLSSCFNMPIINNGKGTVGNTDKSACMREMAGMLDTISIIDNIDRLNPSRRSNVATRPWHTKENASLLELENLDCFNGGFSVNKDIIDVLVESTVSKTEKLLGDNIVNISSPDMSKQRERDVKVSRHTTLSNYLNPSAVLDRRAAALDYWPSCRALCRLEKNKTESSIKRNNRFCHYLKSLNILCKNDFFDNLADSLS